MSAPASASGKLVQAWRDSRRASDLLLARAKDDPVLFNALVLRDEEKHTPIRITALHEEWHDLVTAHKRVVIMSHTESGKAVPLDTPIPVPGGWSTMGALRVGDAVFGSDGRPHTVNWCGPVLLDRPVYRVRLDDGDELLADGDHQWLAWSHDDIVAGKAPRTVTTLEMAARLTRPGGGALRYKWKLPLASPVQHPERALPIHPYVLGAWLGDGTSSCTDLTFHSEDREIYDRCQALEPGAGKPRPHRGREHVMRASLGKGSNFRARLRALGVLNNKHIPEAYLVAAEWQRRELLAGLLDTDGHLSRKGGGASQVEFTSVSERLGVAVLELARSLGFKARMKVADAKVYGRVVGQRFRVFFTAREPVFCLKRKLDAQASGWLKGRARHRSVVAIEPVASVPVRCIGVDSHDHSYLMGRSYTVTHNSQQLTIGRTLRELAVNPNLRVAIIGAHKEKAVKYVRAIARYIERSDECRIASRLRPGDKWSPDGGDLFVEREGFPKDPTVQGRGVHGDVVGSRIDLLILDDILTFENTRTSAGRQDLWDWYHSALTGRLSADAKVIVVGTAFHPDDFLHRLQRNAGWVFRKYPVLDSAGASTWPERWPLARIAAERVSRGPLEFSRQMMCEARDDEDARFKRAWIDLCLERGAGKSLKARLNPPSGYRTYTGVDLAVSKKDSADETCVFSIVVHPDGTRELLAVDAGRWSGPEIIDRVYDHHERFDSIVFVETSGQQDFFRQWAASRGALPVHGFVTGMNKHLEFGVESMAAEMAAGKWVIPTSDGTMQGAAPQVQKWISEMLHYSPATHTGDRLMASWIAREGARMGVARPQTGYLNLR